jgi:O-antigen/teichoic acid export membrane protein
MRASDQSARDRAHGIRGARTNFFTLLGQTSFFVFGALAARLFGQALWGAYTTAYAWVDVLVRASLAGGDKGLLVYIAARRAQGDEAGVRRALVTTVRLTTVLAVILAAGMAVASMPVARLSGEPLDGRAMRLLAPLVISTSLIALLLAATMGTKVLRYNLLAKGVTEPALMLALVVLAGLTRPTLGGLAAVPLVTAVVTLAVAVWSLGRCFPPAEVLRALRRERTEGAVVRFALPLALSDLLNLLTYRLGSFILVAYAPVRERAVFNSCLLLAGSVSFIRGAFDTVLAPVAAEAWVQRDLPRLAENLQRQTRMVLLFAVPFASLYIVGGPAVLSLYGRGFVSGARPLAWLAIGHVLNASLGLTGWVLMAAQRTGLIVANNIVALTVNVGLTMVLAPRLGTEGAALATVATIVVIQILMIVESWRVARVHPLSPGLLRVAMLGTAVIVGERAALRLLLPPTPLATALVLAAGAAIYFPLALRLGATSAAAPRPGWRGRRPPSSPPAP